MKKSRFVVKASDLKFEKGNASSKHRRDQERAKEAKRKELLASLKKRK